MLPAACCTLHVACRMLRATCRASRAVWCMRQAVDGDHPGGAVFFGVCRGKLSEGIDFADKHGRMV